MKSTEQMVGLSVYAHGESVANVYKDLIKSLEKGEVVIDPILNDIYQKVKTKLLPNDIIERYQVFHDCGKPFCLYYDDEGRKHFPDHANVSYEIWSSLFPEEKVIANLIKMDMDFHTLKGEELEELLKNSLAPTLYLTAWAEIISNSSMFGGFESTSFKIKKKKLIQAGKKILK